MILTRRRLLASSLLAAGTLPLTRLAHGQPAHRLTVLHMNDFHSRHEAVDGRALTCSAERPDCFGGSARLAAAIRAQRAAAEGDGRTVLLLDAGDQFQGSLFFTAHRGMAELAVMHEIGTDAMAAGNHEFDMGPGVLGAFVDAARFPVLSANVDASAEPALAGRLRPYAILERAGLRIGLIGLTTPAGGGVVLPRPARQVQRSRPGPGRCSCGRTRGGCGLAAAAVPPRRVCGRNHGCAGDRRDHRRAHAHAAFQRGSGGARAVSGPCRVWRAGGAGGGVRSLPRATRLGHVGTDGAVLAYGGECRHIGLDLPEDPAVAAVVAQYAATLKEVRGRPGRDPAGGAGCKRLQGRALPVRQFSRGGAAERCARGGPGGDERGRYPHRAALGRR